MIHISLGLGRPHLQVFPTILCRTWAGSWIRDDRGKIFGFKLILWCVYVHFDTHKIPF